MRKMIASQLFLVSFGAASLCGVSASTAQEYPWCANYGSDNGGINCGFASYQQCQAALSGNGGYCSENRFFRGYAAPRPPRRGYRPTDSN